MRKALIILGVPIDRLTMDTAIDRLETFISTGRATGQTHQVATVNADFVVNALHDPDLRRILQESDMATADGTPLVWGASLLGVRLEARVTGVDMVQALAKRAAEKQYSLYLLGGRPGIGERAADVLTQRYPGLKIAGIASPEHGPIEAIDPAELEAIKAARPDVLLVAFGNPKQEKFINRYARELGVPVCIGVGGTLDMLAGVTRRAPLWMQRTGLEWLFRVLQEPRRLWKRYVRDLVYFGAFFLRQWWSMRGGEPSDLNVEQASLADQGAVITIHGRLDVTNQDTFAARAEEALAQSRHLVVDLSGATFLDSSALGLLVSLANRARQNTGSLALCSVPPMIAEVLRLVRLDGFFAIYDNAEAALGAQQASFAPPASQPNGQAVWQVVRVPRTLDAPAAQLLMEHCTELLASNPRVILDCADTTMISSAGLASMNYLSRLAAAQGGELRVATASHAILKSLKLVRLDTVVPTFQDVYAAAA